MGNLKEKKEKTKIYSKITYYELITGFIGGKVPNSFAVGNYYGHFETKKEAVEHWRTEYRDRKVGDGYDKHWNNIPCCVRKITTVTHEVETIKA